MISTGENCQGHQNVRQFGKWSRKEKPKDTRLLNVMWCTEWDPGTEEGNHCKEMKTSE
jgi:hypothetical protein